MQQSFRFAAVAAAAFGLGCAVARFPQGAHAASSPPQAAAIDLAALTPAAFPPANPATPHLRTKTLVVEDGVTVAVQMGTVFKHFHAGADEFQLVLEGSGTEWLGDKQIDLKPGTFVVIPKGTAHGGLTDTSGTLKFVSIKTPPQDPADVHPLQ